MNSDGTAVGGKVASLVLKARRQFFKLSAREKFLALLFAVALIGIWFSFQWDRHVTVFNAISAVHDEADYQQNWINEEAGIKANFDALIAQINLEELPSVDEVRSQVDTILRNLAISPFEMGQTKTQEGTTLRFHTIPLDIKQVEFGKVRNFTEELKTKLPYVSLERITISPQARNDSFLDVRYILKSIEYAQ